MRVADLDREMTIIDAYEDAIATAKVEVMVVLLLAHSGTNVRHIAA